jgi:hypothetical protein
MKNFTNAKTLLDTFVPSAIPLQVRTFMDEPEAVGLCNWGIYLRSKVTGSFERVKKNFF